MDYLMKILEIVMYSVAILQPLWQEHLPVLEIKENKLGAHNHQNFIYKQIHKAKWH